MFRYFLILVFIILSSSCHTTTYKYSTQIALIKGETMNYRSSDSSPAPYEAKIAIHCIEDEHQPIIKRYSRSRALELFKKGEVEIVVSGHASIFPEEFKDHKRVMDGTRALIIYDPRRHNLDLVDDLTNLKIGLLKDSAFNKFFVKKAGDLQLEIFDGLDTAIAAFKDKKIDGFIIDQIADRHVYEMLPEISARQIGIPAQPVYWLYR